MIKSCCGSCRWTLQNGEDIGVSRQEQVSVDYKIE